MSWLGFAVYALAIATGLPAVWRWRRAQISPWQGMGLRIDAQAWVDLAGGLAIGAVAMGGVFAVEWGLGVLQVDGL